MKKWIGAISSALVGIFSFIFLCLDWAVLKVSGKKVFEGSGWELLEDAKYYKEVDGFNLFRVSAIIMLVVAVIAILWAIVLVLNNLNVIKLNLNLNMINNIILSVLVLFVVLAIIGLAIFGNEMIDGVEKAKALAGVGAWIQLVVAGLGCAAGWVFARKAE